MGNRKFSKGVSELVGITMGRTSYAIQVYMFSCYEVAPPAYSPTQSNNPIMLYKEMDIYTYREKFLRCPIIRMQHLRYIAEQLQNHFLLKYEFAKVKLK